MPYVFPISISGRKVEQLEANLESLAMTLTAEQMKYLEGIVPFDFTFPHIMIGNAMEYNHLLKSAAYPEKQPLVQSIVPDTD